MMAVQKLCYEKLPNETWSIEKRIQTKTQKLKRKRNE